MIYFIGMRSLYVYILECSDGTYYVGVTNNVGRRYIEHSTGNNENSFTFKRRPLKLVYCKGFSRPIDAIKYEKQIKGWTRAKKEALIRGDFDQLHNLAKCKNETSHTNYQVRVSEAEHLPNQLQEPG